MTLRRKFMLAASMATVLLFGITGYIVQREALKTTLSGIEDEAQTSFAAYQSIWKSRAERLAAISQVLSTMSDVRAAFGTRDEATIRDTAGEIWRRISDEDAFFVVSDPLGHPIATLGGKTVPQWRTLGFLPEAARRFPKQASGFRVENGRLYQIAVTPVYVDSGRGPALLDVLVTGYAVDPLTVQHLKEATGGSDFVFRTGGQVLASTLPLADARALTQQARAHDSRLPYAAVMTPLLDVEGERIGELWIFRSFSNALESIGRLRRDIFWISLAAIVIALALTYAMARNIVRPVERLDRAAAEIIRRNYDHRVEVESHDELGRLAETFNQMCESIQSARLELIRQERIAIIGRLSSSLVHDLRNPLASIYGGAEILVDRDLDPSQVKRLAGNIYRASRRIQELLQDLVNVGRGQTGEIEMCRLREVAEAASETLALIADSQKVTIRNDVSEAIELPLDRSRMERVFLNLVGNAVEAMPDGGEVRIGAAVNGATVTVDIADTGPGVAPQVRAHLFEPFVSDGKKNGLGLGLALARHTVIDHGGEMWVDADVPLGARFLFRLPLVAASGTGTANAAADEIVAGDRKT